MHVCIVKPNVSGNPYDELKWNGIQFKRTLADCAEDDESSYSNEDNYNDENDYDNDSNDNGNDYQSQDDLCNNNEGRESESVDCIEGRGFDEADFNG